MKNHYLSNVRFIDGNVGWLLHTQCMEPDSPLFGATEQLSQGYTGVRFGAAVPASYFIAAYYAPGSAYAGQTEILTRASAAVGYIMKNQNSDGTVDFPETNFHDAAECSYIIQALYPSLKLMLAMSRHTAGEEELWDKLTRLLNGLADGILAGGFHTPNHRWVISAACAILANIIDRTDCLAYMKQFLAEGIDYNEAGEYSERSSGEYNIICNRSLFYLAREYNMPELYDPIARNLSMMMMYFEPDDTINVNNVINPKAPDAFLNSDSFSYYPLYLAMAIQTHNPHFIYMANQILEKNQYLSQPSLSHRAVSNTLDFFHLLLLEPERLAAMETVDELEPPRSYLHYYLNGSVVRYRREDFTATVQRGSPAFLKLQYKNHAVFIRIGGSFYSLGQFSPQSLEQKDDAFTLRLAFRADAGYKRPLTYPQKTSDWNKMDHTKREDVMLQSFEIVCELKLGENEAHLRTEVSGCANVPLKLEIIAEPDGKYIVGDMEMWLREGNYVYQKSGGSVYRYRDGHSLEIKGGFYAHAYGEEMRGTAAAEKEKATIAMTAYSPFSGDIGLSFS